MAALKIYLDQTSPPRCSKQVYLEGKDCHGMQLAYAGKRFSYYFIIPIFFQICTCAITVAKALVASAIGPEVAVVQGRSPLLEGGYMTDHTPQLRVRANLQGGRVSLAQFFVHGKLRRKRDCCASVMHTLMRC